MDVARNWTVLETVDAARAASMIAVYEWAASPPPPKARRGG